MRELGFEVPEDVMRSRGQTRLSPLVTTPRQISTVNDARAGILKIDCLRAKRAVFVKCSSMTGNGYNLGTSI
jgi:hypothetical protein